MKKKKKKKKIIIGLILAVGFFVSIPNNTSTDLTHSATAIITFSDKGPIGGNH